MTVEKKFLILAGMLGCIAVFLIPPFQSPDEYNHFYRIFQLSDGILTGVRTPDARLGGVIPVSVQELVQQFRPLKFHYECVTSADTILSFLYRPLNLQERSFVDFTNTAIYPPTSYLPQVAMCLLLKPLNVSPLCMMYLMRFGMLLCWIFMIHISLKIMPFRKETLSFLNLLPASIFLHASLNADIVTNGLCFLLISFCLKITEYKEVLNFTQQFLLCVITVLIALNKIIYAPLILLLFNNFAKQPNRLKIVGTVISISVLSLLTIIGWQAKTQPLYISYENYHPQYVDSQELLPRVNPAEQIKFVQQHPLHLFKIIPYSYLADIGGTMSNYVGKFGWEANFLPRPLLVLLFLLLIWRVLQDKTTSTVGTRLGYMSLGILLCYAFAGLMYALWCPVGGERVWNFQGRYFIPIFPLFFLALPYRMTNTFMDGILSNSFFYKLLIFSYLYSIFQIFERYYW